MFVKICGTTTLSDAQLAVELGADALGFIFAPSKRQVTAALVAAMAAELPKEILRVGVFTNPDSTEIVRTVEAAGLSAVQLHMPQSPALLEQLDHAFRGRVQLWQVVGVSAPAPKDNDSEEDKLEGDKLAAALHAALREPRLSVGLLDAVVGGLSGGLGCSFAWERVRPMLEAAQQAAESAATRLGYVPPKIVLAGGLDAANVAEAVHTLGPWGVDVVSGVESAPGRKDPLRLEAFLRAARMKPL